MSFRKRLKVTSPSLWKAARTGYLLMARVQNAPRRRRFKKTGAAMIELGSGPKRGRDGWVTIDLYGSDLVCNLAKGIPLPDDSAEIIYASHLLEHLNPSEVVRLLSECRRVLRDGGRVSVSVPDARRYILSYARGSTFRREPLPDDFRVTGTVIDELNYVAHLGGLHKVLFDEENLVGFLMKAGFERVATRDFDPELDPAERSWESIYAIGFA